MAIAINGAGTITGITAGGLPDGCIQAADLASGVGGKCLAVVSTATDASSSTTSTSFADVTGLTVTTGTLATSSSKLLILVHFMAGTQTTYAMNARLQITPSGGSAAYPYVGTGGTTNITMFDSYAHSGSSDLASSETAVYLYQASSTVAHAVNMQWKVESGGTGYMNRSYTLGGKDVKAVSSITAMEIGA